MLQNVVLSGNGLTLSQTSNVRLFQTERLCRGQLFKFDENDRKLSKWVQNTGGEKGETAHRTQFLFFLHCFQKTFTADK